MTLADFSDSVDQTFGCAVNRSKASTATSLMLINHYLDNVSWIMQANLSMKQELTKQTYDLAGTQLWVPARDKLNQTNAASGYGSIGSHVSNCNSIWG